jgi:ribosomal protein L19
MATSIKVRERDKERIDRLQGELLHRRGRRVSQQELVSLLLNLGEAEKERLLEDAARPLTAREIAVLERLCVDTKLRSREKEIDVVVAGAAR